MYRIIIKKEALKELKYFPKNIVISITGAIEQLSTNPRPHGCKKLKGSQENLWRIRKGDYRVVYHIDEAIYIVNVRSISN